MADLSTLNGISEARSKLYTELEKGKINEARALAQERVLRGQVELKATIPLRLVAIIAKSKGAAAQKYAEPLMRTLLGFVGGPAAIETAEHTDNA